MRHASRVELWSKRRLYMLQRRMSEGRWSCIACSAGREIALQLARVPRSILSGRHVSRGRAWSRGGPREGNIEARRTRRKRLVGCFLFFGSLTCFLPSSDILRSEYSIAAVGILQGDGARQTPKLPTTCNANVPGQRRLVARTFFANLNALRAVRPPAVALLRSSPTSKAVFLGAIAGCTPPPLLLRSSRTDVNRRTPFALRRRHDQCLWLFAGGHHVKALFDGGWAVFIDLLKRWIRWCMVRWTAVLGNLELRSPTRWRTKAGAHAQWDHRRIGRATAAGPRSAMSP